MDKCKIVKILLLILAFICLAVTIFLVLSRCLVSEYVYHYPPSEEVLRNPMTGFAPSADCEDSVGKNTLVYMDVTWRELEPEEGVFDFDTIEEKNYLDRWRREGKKVVFRFICDKPEDYDHMDIPDWLFEKTKTGTFYNCPYGRGYSPDYTDPDFIAYHRKAIEALGREYGQDFFFPFIELGSLGHWGEWHVNYEFGIDRFPPEDICRQYVLPYLDAFPNSRFLMRRPFTFISDYDFGVYNDMAGEPDSTITWLGWISQGGEYDEAMEPMELVACPDIWDSSPIGGEFTSSLSMDSMLVQHIERTIYLLKQSHMTFIGPKSPSYDEEEQEHPEEVGKILKNLGYRYGVPSITIRDRKIPQKTVIDVTVENYGAAPIYYSWPVCLYLTNEHGDCLRYELPLDLTQVPGGQSASGRVSIPGQALPEDESWTLSIGVEDPETGEAAVYLAADLPMQDKKYELAHYDEDGWHQSAS